jgi:pimeloyl-ACP methyl ester carboxylesterase
VTAASPGRRAARSALRLSAGATALVAAAFAWGWWVQPSVIVVPLRAAMQWRMGIASRSVDAGGHRWPYIESGPADGPPMVFLHGFGTSKDAMGMLVAEFGRRGWRALAPDLPAFGEHAYHDGERHDGAFYAREAGTFMDAVGAPEAVVVGTSMGGAVACELAIEHPERVRALLMLSPAGVVPPVRNDFMREVDAGGNPLDLATEEDFDRITRTVFARPPQVPAPFRRWFTEEARARRPRTLEVVEAIKPFLMGGLQGRMGAVAAPTLVLYGTADRVTDPSMLSVFAGEMPAARTALLAGSGHVPFSDDFPGTVREMSGFLEWCGLARQGRATPAAPHHADGAAPR